MLVRIKLFAVARQRIGQDHIELSVEGRVTVSDLRRELAQQFPAIADVLPHIRIAVDSSYVPESAVVTAGAEVALIPPVSGG